jgi:hypothetical protein
MVDLPIRMRAAPILCDPWVSRPHPLGVMRDHPSAGDARAMLIARNGSAAALP